MKIKKLWISDYKNVKDIELEFNTELTTLLVGQNGLGKSNLLEAIALIFNSLRGFISQGDAFLFSQRNFDFIITYQRDNSCYQISILAGEFLVYEVLDEVLAEISFKDFVKNSKKYLPTYILGYYSGENKRLRKITSDYEGILVDSLKRNRGDNDSILRPFFFAENKHSQLLLITLVLYKDHPTYSTYINSLFEKYLNIELVKSFDITFRSPDWNFKNIGGVNKSAENLIANINDQVEFPFWNVKGKLDLLLTRFYNYQQDLGVLPFADDSLGYETLTFGDIDLAKFQKDLYGYFENPLVFFSALEATMVVDIFESCSIKLKKNDLSIDIAFEELSEGEQQLLTVLSLVLFFGDKDCLMLLDEPDTHLNPNWQRDYIQLLNEFNLEDRNSHIFVATHSPLLVQSVQDKDNHKFDIILYCKDKDGSIEIENRPDIIENWRIDQVLTSKYFGIENTRPVNTDPYLTLKQEIIRKGELNEDDIELLNSLKDELGYLPFGETITEIESLAFLNSISKNR
ncbi:AAA family ATPase [Pedobacter sp. SL55]|uniref:AAA family ATPase n=1 Tax=Pedobacter sp. SL55 TaxID=2995161 RepID=UPI0022700ECD|nr:AAA family ATPase [Pedobacter sp. SL55]WAC39865.1 AAA family ATPase [Pedobacter sp. SL55]